MKTGKDIIIFNKVLHNEDYSDSRNVGQAEPTTGSTNILGHTRFADPDNNALTLPQPFSLQFTVNKANSLSPASTSGRKDRLLSLVMATIFITVTT